MNVYEELKGHVNEYEAFRAERQKELENINKQGIYSYEGVKRKAEEYSASIREKHKSCMSGFAVRASILQDKIKETYGKKPDNYDTKLNTAISIITAAGNGAAEEDYRKWLAPFKHDYDSMRIFAKIIKGDFAILLKRYEDMDRVMEMLERAKANPDRFFKSPVLNPDGKEQTVFDGHPWNTNGSMEFLFFCSILQEKLDGLDEFINNF